MEPHNKNNAALDSFEKLKKILLTEDQQKIADIEKELESLRAQLKDKEHFIETLDPVLASMLENKIIESKDEMAEALAPIMGEAIKKQIVESKEDVIDALYPVIGSTIRKSIAEAMKNLVKTVNEKLDKTFSFVMLHRKLKSKMSGVSEAEIILKESMPFEIHEVFYIHTKTGILLFHVSNTKKEKTVDEDLISGMLTAIHNFAGKIFDESENQDIHEIQYDNYQIQIEMGRYAYVAVVISGVKNDVFDKNLKKLEQKLHQRFYKLMREFAGDVSGYKNAKPTINKFLKLFAVDKEISKKDEKTKNRGWVFILFIIIIFYGLVFYLPKRSLESKIEAEIDKIKTDIPELVNGNINYDLDGNNLILEGTAQNWYRKTNIEKFLLNRMSVEFITNNIKVENQDNSSTLLEKINSQNLNIDKSLRITLLNLNYVFQNERLFIEGIVHSLAEKVQIGNVIADLSLVPIIINNCRITEDKFNDAQFLIKRIEELAILFKPAQSNPADEELNKITILYNWLNEIPFFTLYIHGHADKQGSDNINQQISAERSNYIRKLLIEKGIDADKLVSEPMGDAMPVASNDTEEGRKLNRRVTFSFHPYK